MVSVLLVTHFDDLSNLETVSSLKRSEPTCPKLVYYVKEQTVSLQ